ncbi:hypothetical protein OE88DRAFT_830985 [Heliocybe sulcata]|uniref:SET domain-containing protein n=1 Tax=Heliocybe sulcata TaxID=5364 RepID=A0A5C3MR16_9AGAM|nr:hypothetical protein OE88DRAFT_830985 [Heliocybe sulcata]
MVSTGRMVSVQGAGRGKGLVAIRDIQRGKLLIKGSPILQIPQQNLVDYLPLPHPQHLPSDRTRFYNLSFVHLPPPLHHSPLQVALAIVQANAVSAGRLDHISMFPTMTSLNGRTMHARESSTRCIVGRTTYTDLKWKRTIEGTIFCPNTH